MCFTQIIICFEQYPVTSFFVSTDKKNDAPSPVGSVAEPGKKKLRLCGDREYLE